MTIANGVPKEIGDVVESDVEDDIRHSTANIQE